MEVVIEPEAEEDLMMFESGHQRFIADKLNELKEEPVVHEDSDVIVVKGRQVFKYVMKEDRGEKDYRAVYDIRDEKVRVIAVFHRDKGYNKDRLDGRI